jgi:HPt (histidine-containing phosphotransfer) domain-containing protein
MAASDPDFDSRLRALNERFAAGLPDTLTKLEAGRRRIVPAVPDLAAATELHKVLHTLAGSAGTFGYPILGQQARVVEQGLRRLLAEPAGDWGGWARDFDIFLSWARRDPGQPFPQAN